MFIADEINDAIINVDAIQSYFYRIVKNGSWQIHFQMRSSLNICWEYKKRNDFRRAQYRVTRDTLGLVTANKDWETDSKAEKAEKRVKK